MRIKALTSALVVASLVGCATPSLRQLTRDQHQTLARVHRVRAGLIESTGAYVGRRLVRYDTVRHPVTIRADRTPIGLLVAAAARAHGDSVFFVQGAKASTRITASVHDASFPVAMRTLAPELEVLAPVRDRAFKRQEELQYLEERGLPVPPYGAAYSVNRGLWGVTIGGKETLGSSGSIPEHAWVLTKHAFTKPRAPETHLIRFEHGRPSGLDGRPLSPVALIEALEALAAPFGIGRGIHLGDTIIGTKGRVAFEAPAAEVLLTAHRELEKLVLTGRQQRIKELVAQPYGDLVHEGQLLDPVCRDIESLLESSQARVTGEVRVSFRPGNLFVEGVDSPHSLMAASRGVYGEAAGEWTPQDALGFSKIVALTGVFHRRAGERSA